MDRKRGILAAICGSMFFMGLQIGGFQLTIFRIASAHSLCTEQASILISAQYLCMIVIPLLSGTICNQWGKRRVLMLAQAVYCAGCLGICVSGSYFALTASILLIGAGYGAAQAMSCAVLTDVYGTLSCRYQNLSQCLFGFAAFLSPLLLQQLSIPWEEIFHLAGLGVLLCTLALFCCRTGWDTQAAGTAWPQGSVLWRQMGLLMVCMMLCVGLENGITYFADPLFAQKQWNEAYAAYALSAFWVMVTAARLIYSRLNVLPLKAVGVMELCLGVILLGVCWAEQPVPAVILFGLAGSCIAVLGPSLITQATLICPAYTGAASSLMTSASGVGSVVMPVAMGAMAERLSIGLSYLLIAALAFLGSLLAWLVYRTISQTNFKR